MIDVVQMPLESKKFGSVLECIDLRRDGYDNCESWIGQSEIHPELLEESDRTECYHLIHQNGQNAVGYLRLKAVAGNDTPNRISQKIFDVATHCQRLPALEVQMVSTRDGRLVDQASANSSSILRELMVEVFRIANINQVKFLYTSSDRGGTAELKQLGLRYSTLSAPVMIDDRLVVILCIPVTNQNFMALKPLKVVGGKDADNQKPLFNDARARCVEDPSVFDKFEALADLIAGSAQGDAEPPNRPR